MISSERPPVLCYVGLGSNLGDRERNMAGAFVALAGLERTCLKRRSRVRETPPAGPVPQGAFLNAVAELETGLAPHRLLDELLAIERRWGRERSRERRWGPRTLDLDLLLYGDVVLRTDRLTLPHPRLDERSFVLEPLAELAPDLLVPGRGVPVRVLVDRLGQTLESDAC